MLVKKTAKFATTKKIEEKHADDCCKVRDHCAAHSIFNLKCIMPKEIPVVFL